MTALVRGADEPGGQRPQHGGRGLFRRGVLLSYFSPIHHRWSRWAVVGLMLLFFGRARQAPPARAGSLGGRRAFSLAAAARRPQIPERVRSFRNCA